MHQQSHHLKNMADLPNWIEVRNLFRDKPAIIDPTEPTYEIEIISEMKTQKRNRDIRNHEKKVGWEIKVIGVREK